MKRILIAGLFAFTLTACEAGPSIGSHRIPWDLHCFEDEAMLITVADFEEPSIQCVPVDDLRNPLVIP